MKKIWYCLGLIFVAYLLYAWFWPRPTVVYLGDSLTKGPLVNEDSRYYSIAGESVMQRVVDLSKNGITAKQGEEIFGKFLADGGMGDLLVLELGANDYLQGSSLSYAKSVLRSIIERAKNAGMPTLIVGINPKYGNVEFDIYKELAEELNLVHMPDLLKDVWGVQPLLLPDGLHPNYKGHEIMGNNFEPYLRQAVDALP